MNRLIQYAFLIVACFFCITVFGQGNNQSNTRKDSVVQLYGIVMTADSLQAIPAASVIVDGTGRGTLTNDQGVFSIAVLKGDKIRFSCVGFKDKMITIPENLDGNQYSAIQLMISDTNWLPATILKPRPTREQFERDFINASVPDDEYEIARQNTDEAKRRVLIMSLPADGREAVNMQFRQQASKYYYQGQQPPINLFNPMAWADFIKAWKRGDFKKK
ncbi:carboxypeptidase-like regulatory domain-containing protein [Foetidibacter luteolus]|uniref:carboxypeptidase-like regulatory domain-containing protein n=1 Tax=Foetidibacter luteolus TaxID=2608880 RepID=UPI00129BDC2D|nr:carboxypeptidase-like regulatory domain-containing protein [Foetidibacter luteolus]